MVARHNGGCNVQGGTDLDAAIDTFDGDSDESKLKVVVAACTPSLVPKMRAKTKKYDWSGLSASGAVGVVKRLHKCKSKALKSLAKNLLGMWTKDLGAPPDNL